MVAERFNDVKIYENITYIMNNLQLYNNGIL